VSTGEVVAAMGIGQFFAAPGASRRAQGSAGAIGRSAFALAISWPRVAVAIACATVAAAGLLPAASASAEGPCPNEILRSELHSGQLPDCRAYELVTPAYKEGAYLSGIFAVSEDGSHVLGSILGSLAGNEGEGLGKGTPLLGAAYELSRSQTATPSWTAAALDPPRSMFHSNGFFDASADLNSATLWELGRHRISAPGSAPEETACPASEGEEELQPEDVTDFYIERPRGTFTRIGPATPDPCADNEPGVPHGGGYEYLGGSADLSHIVFITEAGNRGTFRWPFDPTSGEASALYEYVGVKNPSPALVGVAEDGNPESNCGTRLGSSTPNLAEGRSAGSMYNAISASGQRIFFTAVGEDDVPCGAAQPPADELFAREEVPAGGSAPREMKTVPISCPQTLPQCADANFEGASRDGSKVFFTSSQKLVEGAGEDNAPGDSAVSLGPNNELRGCARTEEATSGCNLYEDELSGSGATLTQKLVLVSGGSALPQVQGVARISQDGSHVFFVAKGALTGPNREGFAPTAGAENLYVNERDTSFPEGHTSFVASLSPEDNVPQGAGFSGDWDRADNRPVEVSENGRYLVFTSQADLTREGVIAGRRQVFQYDAQSESLLRVSIGEGGYGNDNRTPVSDATIVIRADAAPSYVNSDSPTQADGVLAPQDGAVFFTSPDALTPAALNDATDSLGQPVPNIYEYRTGHVSLISDGHDTSTVHSTVGVQLVGSDASGENVFFTTTDSLVAADTDTDQDIYDARVAGGIPTVASPPECSGEGCRGGFGVTPALPSPQSTTPATEAQAPLSASAPALPKPKPKPKRCRRGMTLKHGKCVKRKAKRANHRAGSR
jgi:hypothetical protein